MHPKILYPTNLDPPERPFDTASMARAWIQLPYDEEAGRTPWGPAQRVMTAVRGRGYAVERRVRPGDGRERLELHGRQETKKKPPT